MFDGDTAVPPTWVAPPSNEEWATRVSHEFFDQPATFYFMEKSHISLF
jgi:hypothetical protein